jgi:predicted RNA-binding Zn-ribbon protein involved in translation (DUF1610 family)
MEHCYEVKAFCSNCDFVGQIEIPKDETLRDQRCPECGNRESLRDKQKQDY